MNRPALAIFGWLVFDRTAFANDGADDGAVKFMGICGVFDLGRLSEISKEPLALFNLQITVWIVRPV